jgi:hypothetical protein
VVHSGLESAVSTRCANTSHQDEFRLTSSFPYQLVDTKSVNNTTLLHFLERTVAKHFPNMEEFLEELSKPAEAHRGRTRVFGLPLALN